MKEDELLEKIKVNNAQGFNEINLKPKQVGMFNNFMMVAIEEAKKEVFDDIDKNFRLNLADGVSAVRIDREEYQELKQRHHQGK